MTRKILSQGDLDGACYLYSIANSFFALTSKQITAAQWRKALRALPFKLDDFLSGQGTEALDSTPEYFEGLCRNFLEELRNTRFQLSRHEKVSSKSLRSAIAENQVAIIAIEDGAHWVSVVDADQTQFYLACSAVPLNSTEQYLEQRSPNFQRIFNRTSTFSNLRIWNKYALLVRNVSEA